MTEWWTLSLFFYAFWKTKLLIPTSTAPSKTNWKQHSNKKCLELVNRKQSLPSGYNKPAFFFFQSGAVLFIYFFCLNIVYLFIFFTLQYCIFLWWAGNNCYSLAGKFWLSCYIHQKLFLWISIYFGLYKILLMEKISITWKMAKSTCNSSLLKMIRNLGKMEKLWSCLKNGRRKQNKRVNTLFNKVLGEKDKCVCYFYLKKLR